MHSELFQELVRDRQRRLLADARASTLARLLDRPRPAGRVAAWRHDVGFRLVEAGLRLALGRRSRAGNLPLR